ncbi:MAG: MFS transporter [Microthrixaceae bacterium]
MSRELLMGDEADLVAMLRPRDNVLVREIVASGSTPFALADNSGHPSESGPDEFGTVPSDGVVTFINQDGPFEHYERQVRWSGSGANGSRSSIEISQRVSFRLALPYWGWLYRVPAGIALRKGLRPGARPWWATPDRLSPQQARIAAAATLLNMVGGMLYGLLTQVLTFVSADLGDGSSGEQTTVLAVVRAGIIVTLIVSVLADRVGRRRMAIWAFCGSAGITLLAALAPSMPFVAGSQFIARNLAIAALLCADTIAIEEMPAGSRAMVAGIGTLAYGLGAGIVVMTLPLADIGPWGWRLTFVVAGCSLPLILHCRRHLPESRRYQMMDLGRSGRHTEAVSRTSAPHLIDSSQRISPRRLLIVGSIFVLMNVFLAPASQLQNDYMRTQVGFSGTTIAIFILLTSTPGGIGVLIGGRVADVYGRRWAIIPGLSALAVFYTVFFSTTNALMWLSSLIASIIGGMAAPALAVITAELFPTVRRATIRGVVTGLAVGGSIIGLLVGGALIEAVGYASAFAMLAVSPLLAVGAAFLLPRTHGRELEETSA